MKTITLYRDCNSQSRSKLDLFSSQCMQGQEKSSQHSNATMPSAARTLQLKATLAGEERRHENPVESRPSVTASVPPHLPPQDVAPPRAICRLSVDYQQAADSPPPWSLSPAILPGARRKSSHRRSSCMANHSLLPVQDGEVRAAEWVTPRAQEGRRLAQRRPGGVRVRRAVVIPDAAPRPPQGSIRLGLELGVRPSAQAPQEIAAGYAHQERGALWAQGLRGRLHRRPVQSFHSISLSKNARSVCSDVFPRKGAVPSKKERAILGFAEGKSILDRQY